MGNRFFAVKNGIIFGPEELSIVFGVIGRKQLKAFCRGAAYHHLRKKSASAYCSSGIPVSAAVFIAFSLFCLLTPGCLLLKIISWNLGVLDIYLIQQNIGLILAGRKTLVHHRRGSFHRFFAGHL